LKFQFYKEKKTVFVFKKAYLIATSQNERRNCKNSHLPVLHLSFGPKTILQKKKDRIFEANSTFGPSKP
jgi:hypothetical protein